MEENAIESIEPVTQETGNTESIQPVAQETPKLREAKIDVDGHAMAINELQLKQLWGLPENESLTDKEFKSLVSAYKAQKTADNRSREASKQNKLVNEIAELIQTNPWMLLERAGYNPRQLAEEYLTQAIEEEMLPENERELKRVRQEKEELERQYKEEMTRREQEQFDRTTEQLRQNITAEIIDALEGSSLPKEPHVVIRIADYMHKAELRGLNVPIKNIIPLVEQDLKGFNSSVIKSMTTENLINYLVVDLLKQIRQYDLARLKRPTSNPTPVSQSKSNSNKKLTKEEWRKELAERIKS